MKGLHHEIWAKRRQATELHARAAIPSCDPRTAYEDGRTAKQLLADADAMARICHENEEAILQIEALIVNLDQSQHGSRHRSIAVRHLEDASMRLRRENGDPPEDLLTH